MMIVVFSVATGSSAVEVWDFFKTDSVWSQSQSLWN